MRKETEKDRYEFAQFLCMTPEMQLEAFGYKTQAAFAEEHDLAPKTLSLWKKEKKFKKMKNEMQMELWDDRLPLVVEATFKRAVEDGDVSAQTQYYKLLGVTKEKVETVQESDIEQLILDMIEILKRHVVDGKVLNAISEELLELMKEL